MNAIFAFVHEQLKSDAAQRSDRPGSTTLSLLKISGVKVTVGHIGDTRVSHYRGGGVRARTTDQTEVQRLLEEGVLKKAQAARYPRRNVLLSALSAGRDYDLQESAFLLEPGDRVLLTTDGFHNALKRRTIASLSKKSADFESFWGHLQAAISEAELKDDASCLALEYRD